VPLAQTHVVAFVMLHCAKFLFAENTITVNRRILKAYLIVFIITELKECINLSIFRKGVAAFDQLFKYEKVVNAVYMNKMAIRYHPENAG